MILRLFGALSAVALAASLLLAGVASGGGGGKQAIVRFYKDGGLERSTITACYDSSRVGEIERSFRISFSEVTFEWRDCQLASQPVSDPDTSQQPKPQDQPQGDGGTPQQPKGIVELDQDLPDPQDVVIGGPVGGGGYPQAQQQPQGQPQNQQQGQNSGPGVDSNGCPLPDPVQGTTGGCRRVVTHQPGGTVGMPCMTASDAIDFSLTLELLWDRAQSGGDVTLSLEDCGTREATP